MKLTTNYVVYLNADNKVQCAKCRITGRFAKRVIAQTEYEKEYGSFAFSTLSMLVVLFTMYLSNVLNKFSDGKTIVLFTQLNTCLFNSKVSSEKELTTLLNTDEVKEGRVL